MFSLSKRWETMFFLFTGATIAYTLRVNMSVCAQKMKDELDWSETEKGLVLSAFFWGYSAGQIPASLVAEKLGSKATFGFAILAPSVLTLLVPLASRTSFSAILLTRAFIGLAAAATFPSIYHFYPRWVPSSEKTKMISFSHSGMYVGEMLGFALSGGLINTTVDTGGMHFDGWELVFYLFGLFGIIWFPFFVWRVYDTPEEHPYISPEEVLLIKNGRLGMREEDAESMTKPLLVDDNDVDVDGLRRRRVSSSSSAIMSAVAGGSATPGMEGLLSASEDTDMGGDRDNSQPARKGFGVSDIPWGPIFTHPVALTLFFNMWTYGWIGYMVLTEMPSFLTDVLGYDLEDAGMLSVVPYVANFVSVVVFGSLFDYMQAHREWSVYMVRQWAERIAFIGSGSCLIACGFLHNPGVAFTFMVLALWCFGALQSGIACAYLDTAPNFSTIMNTIGNMIGAIAGVMGPIVVSLFVTTWSGREGWQMVFFLTAGMCVVSLIVWKIYMKCEIIPALNTPVGEKKEYDRNIVDEKN